jgi:lipase
MAKDILARQATHWQCFGSGARKAVALHCSLAHLGAWKGMFGHLEEPLSMTAFDLPGHGKSANWDGGEDYTALCARVAKGFIEGPVDLIGHSGGAVAALQIALEMPEMIRTLTLIEPVLFAAARGFDEFDAFQFAMAQYRAALAADQRMLATEKFTEIWGTGTPWAEIDERSRQYMADRIHLIEAGMPALADDNFGILAEDRLEGLAMPVMIIIGTACPPIIPRIAEVIAARLPDVGLAEVPGAGHLLPVTHPAQVAGLIDVNLSRDG